VSNDTPANMTPAPPAEGSRRLIILIAAALTLLATALVWFRAVPVGVPGQWVIAGGRPTWSALFYALPALGLILLLTAAVLPKISSASRAEEAIAVAMLAAFLLAAQFAVGSLGRFGAQESFIALATNTTNRYFEESGRIEGTIRYLRTYRKRAAESEGWQLKTHPPGPVLFFYGTRRIVGACPPLKRAVLHVARKLTPRENYWRNQEALAFLDAQLDDDAEAAGWLSVALLRLAAALSCVPLYLLARKLYDKRCAFIGAALGGLIPSLLLFNALIDQLYPLIGLVVLLIARRAAERQSLGTNVAAGLVLFVGLLFSLSFVAFAVIAIAMQAWLLLTDAEAGVLPKRLRRLMLMTETLMIGLLLGAVGVFLLSRLNLVGVWAACIKGNARFNSASGRTYLAWLAANPLMFTAFLGLPAAVLWVRSTASDAGRLIMQRTAAAIEPLPIITAGTLALLWLYGANLGEVERLWMPLMPLCALAGAGSVGGRTMPALVLIALQGLQAVVFRMSLDPLGLGRIVQDMTTL